MTQQREKGRCGGIEACSLLTAVPELPWEHLCLLEVLEAELHYEVLSIILQLIAGRLWTDDEHAPKRGRHLRQYPTHVPSSVCAKTFRTSENSKPTSKGTSLHASDDNPRQY